MEKIYLTLILNDRKKLSEVPAILKNKVIALLDNMMEKKELTQERYNEIIRK